MSTTPAVLAVILGPIAEENLRRALLISNEGAWILFRGPISLILITLILATIFLPIFKSVIARKANAVAPTNT